VQWRELSKTKVLTKDELKVIAVGASMKTRLRMKCSSCGHWNRVLVNKIFIEQPSTEPKVKVLIPMYEPLQVSGCDKCGQVVAEPRELIKIVKNR
jgi:hypothetical protein